MKKIVLTLILLTNSYSEDMIEYTSYMLGAVTRGFIDGLNETKNDTTTKDTVYIDENARLDIIMRRQEVLLKEINTEPEEDNCVNNGEEVQTIQIHTKYCR